MSVKEIDVKILCCGVFRYVLVLAARPAPTLAATRARLQSRSANLLSVTLSLSILGGRSSGVERNLAKVEVVSSNLIARSIILEGTHNYVSRLRLASSAP